MRDTDPVPGPHVDLELDLDLVPALRFDDRRPPLGPEQLDPDPLTQFRRWLAEAVAAGALEPTAMTVATADVDGRPSARTMLLKGLDDRGFLFFTNYDSRKARELAVNPRAALVFRWLEMGRQVTVTGSVEGVDAARSDAYFARRPRGSQIAAWASAQSSRLQSREALEAVVAEVTRRYEGREVPRPPFWGGYRLVPAVVELWQGRPDRLHDRLRYLRTRDGWVRERLNP